MRVSFEFPVHKNSFIHPILQIKILNFLKINIFHLIMNFFTF